MNKSLNPSCGEKSSFWVEDPFKDFVMSNLERIMAISIAILSEAEWACSCYAVSLSYNHTERWGENPVEWYKEGWNKALRIVYLHHCCRSKGWNEGKCTSDLCFLPFAVEAIMEAARFISQSSLLMFGIVCSRKALEWTTKGSPNVDPIFLTEIELLFRLHHRYELYLATSQNPNENCLHTISIVIEEQFSVDNRYPWRGSCVPLNWRVQKSLCNN